MKDKVRFGVIGLSRVARKNSLRALTSSPYIELVMLGSNTPTKADECAKEYQVSLTGAYEDVLAHTDIDAVYISLPNTLHEEWAVRVAQSGKHIWCEKPAALNLESATRMVQAAKEHRVRIMEGFTFLTHPQHQKVRSLIEDGTLGKPLRFEGCFSFPMPDEQNSLSSPAEGGALFDSAVYPLRASTMLLGKPESVFCTLKRNADNLIVQADIVLTHAHQAVSHVSSAFGASFRSTYSLLCDKGYVEMERAYAVPPNRTVHIHVEKGDVRSTLPIAPTDQFTHTANEFALELLTGKSKRLYEDELLTQATILEACIHSDKEGRLVQLSQFA